MTEQLTDDLLHEYLEQIAARGCADVNQLITDIDNGMPVPEIAHLDEAQQQQVITELKKVMKVYDSCDTDV
jgi:hypothetical protein